MVYSDLYTKIKSTRQPGLLIATCIILVLFSCKRSPKDSEERIERFETGVVSRRVPMVGGLSEGKMTDYYPDGKLMAERWFYRGKQHGQSLFYYPSGTLKEVQYFETGSKQGGDTIWYEDGRMQFAVFFEQNKKNGYLRKWSNIGTLIFESKYIMDTLVEVKGVPINPADIHARYAADTLLKPSRQ